jgi:transketolase
MNTIEFSKNIRKLALQMVYRANASHIGGVLSMADILAVLYNDVLSISPYDPTWEDRDRFILSKGHCCTGVYAALALKDFFPIQELVEYAQDGSLMMSHISHHVPGVEFSTGSLGHGLPFGVGKALAAKRLGRYWRTYVMLSDGELDEGSNWEAIMFAAHHRLDNLIAIVDYNKLQSLTTVDQTIVLEPLADKFKAFNWHVLEIDGHDHDAIRVALSRQNVSESQPLMIIAHTTKGKGVSFMENKVKWHYMSPNLEQLKQALAEIECTL